MNTAPVPPSDPTVDRLRPTERIDLSKAKRSLEEALRRVTELHDTQVNPRLTGKARGTAMARVSRELVYIDHLCRRGGILVLDEYHLQRGFDDHLAVTP